MKPEITTLSSTNDEDIVRHGDGSSTWFFIGKLAIYINLYCFSIIGASSVIPYFFLDRHLRIHGTGAFHSEGNTGFIRVDSISRIEEEQICLVDRCLHHDHRPPNWSNMFNTSLVPLNPSNDAQFLGNI